MFTNKYFIDVKCKNYVCDETGKVSKYKYTNFLKSKNNFIFNSLDNEKIIVKSPMCSGFNECYNKFEEIVNVFTMALHEKGLLRIPFYGGNKLDSDLEVCFIADKEFLKAIKIDIDYKKFVTELQNKKWVLMQILYGISFRYDEFNESVCSILEDFDVEDLIKISFNNGLVKISFRYADLFDKCGIKKCDLAVIVCFLFACLLKSDTDSRVYNKIQDIFSADCRKAVKNKLRQLVEIDDKYDFGAQKELNKLLELLESKKITNQKDNCYKDKTFILELAKQYYQDSFSTRYVIKQFPKLDGSEVALIKDALSEGIDFNVIDEVKSFVEFKNGNHTEEIILATMTNRDSYILAYITDDKQFAKNILLKNNLRVPEGILLNFDMSRFEIECEIEDFINKPAVIKPKSTNSGTGITIFSCPATKEEILNAVNYAFKFDSYVLVEEFIKGKEYRFLVIDDKCIGVVHRRSASVVGDGKSSFRELIDKKNQEPWHGLLENPVVMDKVAEDFLSRQGYTFESIPNKDERIFLRENSNCSTGGECIDMTDVMPQYFKKIAEKATKCFNAKIAGVDIMIDDLASEEYSIIEVNDNPGYSLNEWPYEGKGVKVGLYILKMLGF